MKINQLKDLLRDKRVVEEVHKHLWIESQKAGHSVGLEHATDGWLSLYGLGWMKYNMPQEYKRFIQKGKIKAGKKLSQGKRRKN